VSSERMRCPDLSLNFFHFYCTDQDLCCCKSFGFWLCVGQGHCR
jgi:hypothetical protein